MIELPFILVAGVLGSTHCIGMCGPFALSIGGTAISWTDNLWRQIIFSCGRIFTYTTAGAIAGFVGLRLSEYWTSVVNLPAVLAILALIPYQYLPVGQASQGEAVTIGPANQFALTAKTENRASSFWI